MSAYIQAGGAAPGGLQAIAAGRSSEPKVYAAGGARAVATMRVVTNFVADQTVTVNGTVITAKGSGATGPQFNIGGTPALSVAALVTVLNGSADAAIAKATYSANGETLICTFDEGGEIGNAFTLASNLADDVIVPAAGGANLELPDSVYHYFDSTQAVDQYYDLPEGIEGTRRVVALRSKSAAGGAVVRADFDGGTTITFDAAGEYAILEYVIGQWVVVKNTGTLA